MAATTGCVDARREAGVDALGRLPGAVDEAGDEDVVDARVALDVGDAPVAVAGDVDVADR